ncbi:hypothetical protein OS493_011210 [Desmophyllum pertusum]|uniref:Uncharacterized protein n=1 Tax=Desmophyllum pertusum TaxID=174260 RepID=A0A9X0CS28_9CNID|nr:hypothetical protein OS493_011210 [Desmophyllum pertusum]
MMLMERFSGLIDVKDTTIYPYPSRSFYLHTAANDEYLPSIKTKIFKPSRIVAKQVTAEHDNDVDDNTRFFPLVHGSYSLFESKKKPNHFLGCTKEGNMELIELHDKRHPDPRVLFLIHRYALKDAVHEDSYHS